MQNNTAIAKGHTIANDISEMMYFGTNTWTETTEMVVRVLMVVIGALMVRWVDDCNGALMVRWVDGCNGALMVVMAR